MAITENISLVIIVDRQEEQLFYNLTLLNPNSWYDKSLALYDIIKMHEKEINKVLSGSLDDIGEHIHHLWFIRMICGFCLENIIKGILIKVYVNKSTKEDLKKVSELPEKIFRKHNLNELIKELEDNGFDFGFKKNYIHYLKSLSQCSIWTGRYPTPTNCNGYSKIDFSVSGDDIKVFKDIYKVMEKTYKTTPLKIQPGELLFDEL